MSTDHSTCLAPFGCEYGFNTNDLPLLTRQLLKVRSNYIVGFQAQHKYNNPNVMRMRLKKIIGKDAVLVQYYNDCKSLKQRSIERLRIKSDLEIMVDPRGRIANLNINHCLYFWQIVANKCESIRPV